MKFNIYWRTILFVLASVMLMTPAFAEETKSDEKVAATVEQSAEADDSEDAEDKKESKWWNLSFGYSFSHNLAKERPSITNAFSIDPGAMIPKAKIAVGLHLGFFVASDYASGVVGGRDVTIHTVDMDPISLSLSRNFPIDPDTTGFAVKLSLGQLFPMSSEFAGQVNDWYYAIKPGLGLSLSKWGLTLSNTNSLQKNFHGYAFAQSASTVDGTKQYSPLNSWTYTNSTSLSYSVWKLDMSIGVSWSRSWRYKTKYTETPNNLLSYFGSIGITPYKGLHVGLSVSTAGPERRYGGFKNDYTVPLDPRFTNISFSISYSL